LVIVVGFYLFAKVLVLFLLSFGDEALEKVVEDADQSVPDLLHEVCLFVAFDCDFLDEIAQVLHQKGLLIGEELRFPQFFVVFKGGFEHFQLFPQFLEPLSFLVALGDLCEVSVFVLEKVGGVFAAL
jgi:hypothetical protein